MEPPGRVPHLSAIEQRRFCDGEGLPGRLRRRWTSLPPDERAKRELDLYETVCGCPTPAATPMWVRRLREQVAGRGGADYFPNIMVNEGVQAYDAARDALYAYRRRHKSFFELWKSVYRAARKASLGLDPETGTKCVVYHSEREWNEFLHGLSSKIVSKLRDEVRDRAAGAAMTGMKAKQKMRLRFKALTGYLDRIGALHMIWKGVQEREMCERPDDHPKAVARKEEYFLGLLARGPEHYRALLRRYEAYDRAHWELWSYTVREKRYRSGRRPSGHARVRAAGGHEIDILHPADLGLHR